MSLLPDNTFAAPGVPFFGSGGSGPVGPDLTVTGNLTVEGTSTLAATSTTGDLVIGEVGPTQTPGISKLSMNSGAPTSAPFIITADGANAVTTLVQTTAGGTPSTTLQLNTGGVVSIGAATAAAGGILTVDSLAGAFAKTYAAAAPFLATSTSVKLGSVLIQGGRCSYTAGGATQQYTFPTPFADVPNSFPALLAMGTPDVDKNCVVNSTAIDATTFTVAIVRTDGAVTTDSGAFTWMAIGVAPA